ncbi:OLC1v1004645C1 [Oldenlandia corymbosa var. corymbosa]|uniref:Germin-like protein n=1 Tax=Oldenlandia corymbosa var. corymbosa TaxID=529605 RepID=A0AAV1DCS3_OLDCO|nr:OLC1v1004645C1 [Oldenlandia corymbosa var. corymbosa]
MASPLSVSSVALLTLVAFILANSLLARAGDPDITSDFLVPDNINASTINGTFFTNTGFRGIFGTIVPKLTITKATKTEFPALDGQSVSFAVVQYPAGSVNPPHVHPRSAELLFVLKGSLDVGFVDTTNKLFTQTLQENDMFVFPKGLVHFQFNSDPNSAATAIAAFGSVNAGTASLPTTLFSTNIDDDVLAESFKTDVPTILKIKAGLAPPA